MRTTLFLASLVAFPVLADEPPKGADALGACWNSAYEEAARQLPNALPGQREALSQVLGEAAGCPEATRQQALAGATAPNVGGLFDDNPAARECNADVAYLVDKWHPSWVPGTLGSKPGEIKYRIRTMLDCDHVTQASPGAAYQYKSPQTGMCEYIKEHNPTALPVSCKMLGFVAGPHDLAPVKKQCEWMKAHDAPAFLMWQQSICKEAGVTP